MTETLTWASDWLDYNSTDAETSQGWNMVDCHLMDTWLAMYKQDRYATYNGFEVECLAFYWENHGNVIPDYYKRPSGMLVDLRPSTTIEIISAHKRWDKCPSWNLQYDVWYQYSGEHEGYGKDHIPTAEYYDECERVSCSCEFRKFSWLRETAS